MKLEYRILEVAEGDKQDCNYCSFSFRDFRFKDNLTLNIAIHQVAAFKDNDNYADIHPPTKSNRHSLKFTSKTYENLFFSKISIVRIYYVNRNDLGTVVKLIDCIFRKK